MKKIGIDNTDENADWIKALSDDVKVSKDAKRLLKKVRRKGILVQLFDHLEDKL